MNQNPRKSATRKKVRKGAFIFSFGDPGVKPSLPLLLVLDDHLSTTRKRGIFCCDLGFLWMTSTTGLQPLICFGGRQVYRLSIKPKIDVQRILWGGRWVKTQSMAEKKDG